MHGSYAMIKLAYDSALQRLHEARSRSDKGDYGGKVDILRQMMKENPSDFEVDSWEHGFAGITHVPTGYRLHIPRKALSGFDTRDLTI